MMMKRAIIVIRKQCLPRSFLGDALCQHKTSLALLSSWKVLLLLLGCHRGMMLHVSRTPMRGPAPIRVGWTRRLRGNNVLKEDGIMADVNVKSSSAKSYLESYETGPAKHG
jgi:hypothetical protein